MNPILRPLSAGFRLAVALRQAAYRRGWLKIRRLKRPVVSVGNLTTGGTGKTPLVALIARTLQARGWNPGILTRGYGRRSSAGFIAIEPRVSRTADPRQVGDEPALLAQTLPEVPIVVCADRYRGGRLAEDRFEVGVHILDDGFQHLALARDVDIIVLDVTQELSDRALLPAGRLREPCAALERAHFVVLSRVDQGSPDPIEARVRNINPKALFFHSQVKLRALVNTNDLTGGQPASLPGQPVFAFCGIGNPQAFFRDLRKWGFTLAGTQVFSDHHVYSGGDLQGLSKRALRVGAAALVTTEKDAVNLPLNVNPVIPVVACAVQTEISEKEEFEAGLLERLEKARKAY